MTDVTLEQALWRLPAVDTVDLLRRREVSPSELVDIAARRIEAVEPAINALPTLCLERARSRARALENAPRSDTAPGWLGGLPIAVKDITPVAGVRTTYGSPIYADYVPERSDILVERLESNGALVIGKSNTPEFAAGASTFNEVFGKTRNPWNTGKSVAGSSGGSAAALAAGEVWLATGSDLGGSLRTPASFNSVVGLRPSPGRVLHGPVPQPFANLSVAGPMARTVADVALMLDACAGQHREDPLSLAAPQETFLAAAREARAPRRVAFSANLGLSPVDREVARICEQAAKRLSELGITVEEASPDFSGARETFQTLRAAWFAGEHMEHLARHRDQLKPEVVWNIEKGLALTAEDIARAERERGALYRRVVDFFADYDLLLCPTAIVPPFDVDVRYVEEVEGHRFDNYVDWIGITFVVTLTSCPALSLPAGFTADGLPVGVQLVAPPRAESALLGTAALLERTLQIQDRTPIDPRNASRSTD